MKEKIHIGIVENCFFSQKSDFYVNPREGGDPATLAVSHALADGYLQKN